MFDKKSWSREYLIKNRERINQKKREWRKNNPDKVKIENDKRKEYSQEWRKSHKKIKFEYDYTRRNEQRFSGMRDLVLERDNYECALCRSKDNLVIHHKDGNGRNKENPNNSLENLLTLCTKCHMIVHNGHH